MECPKCKKTVGENDAVCRNCGIALKEPKRKKLNVKKMFDNKKKSSSNLKTVQGRKGIVRQRINENKLKVALFVVALVLIIVLLIVFISHISGEKGNKAALELKEYLGNTVSNAQSDSDIHLKDSSSFRGINTALAFDFVYESEDEIKINDIAYPEWAVTVSLNKNEKIESVTYTDFTSIEEDMRGEKKDRALNLDKFDKGAKYNTVTDEIDCDPYSITYKEDLTSYRYKYYYTVDNGDAQQVILTAVFDSDNKFLYYSSELVYPQNL